MKTDPNDCAFARPPSHKQQTGTLNGSDGLTKLEYFAALAMQGIQASNLENERQKAIDIRAVAIMAVAQAKALIQELNRGEKWERAE